MLYTLSTPLNISKLCQQKKAGKYTVKTTDLSDIPECQQGFEIEYAFSVENSHRILVLSFQCTLSLRCQSCWENYEHDIISDNRLVLTQDSSEETHNELSALGYEVIIIDDSQNTSMLEILKEELFLQIPHVPRCNKHSTAGQGTQLVINEEGMNTRTSSTAQADKSQEVPTTTNRPFHDLLKKQRS